MLLTPHPGRSRRPLTASCLPRHLYFPVHRPSPLEGEKEFSGTLALVMYIKICMLLIALFSGVALAELPGVLRWEVERDMETTYSAVYQAQEENRFFVVFEPDIGRNISSFAERWGEDYKLSLIHIRRCRRHSIRGDIGGWRVVY